MLFITLIGLGIAPVEGATPGSVSGVVRNSAGAPQMGAVVQLLRPDMSVLAVVYTDSKGEFSIPGVQPGHYAVKAMAMSFLPSLRENVRVRHKAVVNLTLSTLYEVMQWLPAEPRSANAHKDDWAWTLRSAANRPLLRWLEDGPLVVVTDGPGAHPKLKARLIASGQAGTFGESGERITAAVENTPSSSKELLARVDFAPGTDAGMESMLGFRQDLGFAGSVQSVAAITLQPDVDSETSGGLQEAAIRSWESIQLGDEFEAEAGAAQVMARFAQNSPNTVLAALPFATVGWRKGNSIIRYRMSTVMPSGQVDESEAAYWMPKVAMRDGILALERGLHQEVGWERQTDGSGISVAVYSDRIQNPVMEAAGRGTLAAGGVLLDRTSGLLRLAGPNFSTAGMLASVEGHLPGGNHVRLSYANGDALVMPAVTHATPMSELIVTSRPRHVQTYALALSGTLDGSGTRWRASYRWQPANTVTQVAPFAVNAIEPYLTLHVRQPLCIRRDGSSGIEALVDVRNLLAEGYHPYVLSDGSVVIFAQDQRSIRGGLAFTF
ncbi:MAG TPA: TonB-dependent receptor [Terracidiphilus sp.]|nr:TonB-dependent receptor [Terracidiphilus sp.]